MDIKVTLKALHAWLSSGHDTYYRKIAWTPRMVYFVATQLNRDSDEVIDEE